MTLEDLYNNIDWSGVSLNHERWVEKYGRSLVPTEDFLYQFRCVLLDESLHGEGSMLSDARKVLGPIWFQVLGILRREGLVKKTLDGGP